MATYTIVAEGTDPLGPGEIEAGTRITVADGDIFIIDSTADADTRFVTSGSSTASIEIRVEADNSNNFILDLRSGITADINVSDDVTAGSLGISAGRADQVDLTVGDNAELDFYTGTDGGDVLTIGDNFIANGDISTGDGADTITIGNNADIQSISTGRGNDTIDIGDDLSAVDIGGGRGADIITLGNGATINDLLGGNGGDDITVGDNFTANRVRGAGGDDNVTIGSSATINSISGGAGNDTLTTQTPLPGATGFETIVCFVKGSMILTKSGYAPIENLRAGDLVKTMDSGWQSIRWIGSSVVAGYGAYAPIHILSGALGNYADLWVSQQHRMLIDGWRAELLFGDIQVLVPAKHLVDGENIKLVEQPEVEYFHILFDRHEIIYSEGIASESFHPGEMGLGSLDEDAREEIMALFPDLRFDLKLYGPASRPSLRSFEGQILLDPV